MAAKKKPKSAAPKRKINFHYEKSRQFRVIHADGVHGGLTPHMNIHMAIFSERQPIPQRITHAIEETGLLGEEDKSLRQQKDGFFREVEADIIFSLVTAKRVSEWLAAKVDEAEQIARGLEDKSRC